ncbi:MAG: hypothetical protein ACEPOZ_15940 [Marinifilaceae bacterium]
MKKIHHYLFLCFVLFPHLLWAQKGDIFYPRNKHTKLDYISFDKKNQQNNHHCYSLFAKICTPGCNQFVVEDEIVTQKKDMIYHQFKMTCRDGKFFLGMEKYFNPFRLEAYRNMEILYQADSLEIPSFAESDRMLPDCSATATILGGCGSQILKMQVHIHNRRFESIDSVSTSAGIFKCCKLSFDKIEIVGAFRRKTHHLEWYAPNIGLVRAENYNKKGKLTGYTLLQEIGEEFLLP